MILVLVFFLLFLLPFVIAPFGITQFENPKVIVAEAIIILLFLISVFCKKHYILFSKQQKVVYGVIVLLTVVDVLFFRTSISFFGNAFRMQGIFLLWLLFIFSVVASKVTLQKILWVVSFLLILAQVVAMVLLPLNESGRSVGTMGEPNASAAFLLFLWPFLWFARKKNIWWNIVILFSTFLCLCLVFYFTHSRSALIGFSLQIFMLVLLRMKIALKKVVIICCCLLVASFSLPFFEKNVLYENRGEVWTAALYAGLHNPVVGGGFGNTELLLHQSAQEQHLRIRKYYVDSAHNIFLDWWVQGGIVGLGVFCWLIFTACKQFVRKNEIRNLVLLVGLVTALSFNPASVVGLLQLWWLIGVGFTE